MALSNYEVLINTLKTYIHDERVCSTEPSANVLNNAFNYTFLQTSTEKILKICDYL